MARSRGRRVLPGFVLGFVLMPGLVAYASQPSHHDGQRAKASDGPVAIAGTLEIHAADGLDGTHFVFPYLRATNGELIRLHGDRLHGLTPGTRLEVEGHWLPTKDTRAVDVSSWTWVGSPQSPPGASASAARRVAVLLIHFGDPGPDSSTVESMRDRVFGGPQSTASYYDEVSYGGQTLNGDVFGWYELDVDPDVCDYNSWGVAARTAFVADGHDFQDYDHLMYYFPNVPVCTWAGLGAVGTRENPARDSWYNGFSQCVVLVQEIGHNFGMAHSRTYTCTSGGQPVPISANCTEKEYGNPICPLGFGPCGHLMAYQKAYMGYFEPCNMVTAHSDGIFKLSNLERRCEGIQGLRVPRGDGTYYILEYRSPVGFDGPGTAGAGSDDDWPEGLAGVLVQVAGEHQVDWGEPAYLLDMTPGSRSPGTGNTSQDHLDGFLAEGETFADPDGMGTFTVSFQDDVHAVIEIDLRDDTGAPTCDDGAELEDDNGVFGVLACDGFALDVSIDSPEGGARFPAGEDVPVTAQVTADGDVMLVELAVDGSVVQSDATPPYEWTVSGLSLGRHALTAIAHDRLQESTSSPVEVIVELVGDGDGDEGGDSDGGDGDSGGNSGDSGGGDDGDSGVGDDAGDQGTGTTTTTSGTSLSTSTGGGFPGGFDDAQGCACRQSSGPGQAGLWGLGTVLGLFGSRRRRVKSACRAATG